MQVLSQKGDLVIESRRVKNGTIHRSFGNEPKGGSPTDLLRGNNVEDEKLGN